FTGLEEQHGDDPAPVFSYLGSRVCVLAEGEGSATSVGSANINPVKNPYLDIHGNPVKMTRMVSQSGTDSSNAPASAQLQLNRFINPRSAVTLKGNEVGVEGSFRVGDYVWVWDPLTGLYDKTVPPN